MQSDKRTQAEPTVLEFIVYQPLNYGIPTVQLPTAPAERTPAVSPQARSPGGSAVGAGATPQLARAPQEHLAVAAAASKSRAQRSVLVCEVEDVLGKASALYDASNFDCAFLLDEFADCEEQAGGELGVLVCGICHEQGKEKETYLRVPSVLPCDESDKRGTHIPCVPLVFAQFQYASHGFW